VLPFQPTSALAASWNCTASSNLVKKTGNN